ncbi:MAG: class I tRNA ligase family protein, partial [Phycisphaerae bacterium]|nr:class I tRNA ligase family protein [Phycisphaerae bacterium]
QPAAYGDQCEACGQNIDPLKLIHPVSVITGTTPEVRETTHWYLQLAKFQGMLADWFSLVSLDWRPIVTNFALARIKDGLPERAMTRDLRWGVPVPLDDPEAAGKVLYVWFDAPIGYVSFTAALCAQRHGDPERYRDWWQDPDCKILHFIGEDNIVFHALIWPAMLLGTQFTAEEVASRGSRFTAPKSGRHFQLPSNVVANAFVNIKFPGKDEEKISKSRGTAVWIEDYLQRFDPDPLRFYLTAIAPENQRTTWDFEAFVERNNSELIATLGNFVNRWQKIVTDDHGRVVPAAETSDVDRAQLEEIRGLAQTVGDLLEACSFKAALGQIMDGFRSCNRYIDAQAPWKSRKTDTARCAATIFVCIQCTRTLGTLLTPFLPFAGEKIRRSLGCEPHEWTWAAATAELPAGRALGPTPEILFRRIELSELLA